MKKSFWTPELQKNPLIFIMYISVDQNSEFVCSGPYPCNYNKLKIKGLFNPNSLARNSADILLIISRLIIKY